MISIASTVIYPGRNSPVSVSPIMNLMSIVKDDFGLRLGL